ncbi:alpha/beta hydrolase [Oceaniglobus roseus]|uniref:alpha/beta hydrolase n=1 Tax=Oceaniglobus roseus TaxID=1737570 RepID=UPI000C7EC0C4|nr:alpha/beta fold hydrolase [Kandeliimicrobium roseum]
MGAKTDIRRWIVATLAVAAVALSLWQLQRDRAGLSPQELRVGATPVTLWQGPGPLVVVAHGFAGSRQMMQAITHDLARAGFTVAAFDFDGHGRNPVPLSPDIGRIEGTTAQLVAQTRAVVAGLREVTGQAGPVSFVGHSMATDVVLRAAHETDDVAAVVVISMYSEVITPEFPTRLLAVSGAFEGGLREVALRAVRQVDAAAEEGGMVSSGEVARRAVVAPGVGHVGVLYSPVTLGAVRAWLAEATGRADPGTPPRRTGPWRAALLVALVALFWPLAGLLPDRAEPLPPPMTLRRFWAVALVPVLPATAAGLLAAPLGLVGLAGFAALGAVLATWGAVQLALLWRDGRRPARPSVLPALALLAWGLGIFALALDRYGAAFLPVGPRFGVMLALLPAGMLFMLADAVASRGAPLWRRLVLRALPLVVLAGVMIAEPGRLGMVFTVLPVLVLFHLAYTTMGRWSAARGGPTGTGLALGLCLAWAIAASTPLFAAM